MEPEADSEVLPPLSPLHILVQPAQEHRGPPDAYRNSSRPRGAVFIANFRSFSDGKHSTREGSEKDVEQMKELFKQMGYMTFEGLNDASKEETQTALHNFRDHKVHSEADSLVMIVMSHGCYPDQFITSDGEVMECKEVYEIFSNDKCSNLSGKPKLFIFQMCRGADEHVLVEGVTESSAIPSNPPFRRLKRAERKLSDIFICFSSLAGFVSYRHPRDGSPFLHHICRVFMLHAKDEDLDELMRKVERELPEALASETRKISVPYKYFFNPSGQKQEEAKTQQTQCTCLTPEGETALQGKCLRQMSEQKREHNNHQSSDVCLNCNFDSVMQTEEQPRVGWPLQARHQSSKPNENKSSSSSSSSRARKNPEGSKKYLVQLKNTQSASSDCELASAQCAYGESRVQSHTLQQGEPCSPQSIPLHEELFPEEHESSYKNSSVPRGHVLIVNNLPGCSGDVIKLVEVFTLLGYHVLDPLSALSRAALVEHLEKFKESDHRDSVIVVFYGDGFEDYLVSSDGKVISFDDLLKTFNDVNFPQMAGKPKVFITNTCYYSGSLGKDTRLEVTVSSSATLNPSLDQCHGWTCDGPKGITELKERQVPADRDMLLFSVEVDDGRCEGGSLLTEALYQVLLSHNKATEIMSLLRSVTRRLSELEGSNEQKYYTEVRNKKFQRKFYLNAPKSESYPSAGASSVEPQYREMHRSFSYPHKPIGVKSAQRQAVGNKEEVYKNCSEPRGLALIISFDQYQRNFPSCPWRKDDAKILKKLFEMLGYKVAMHENPSLDRTKEVLQEFSTNTDLSRVDSMVAVVQGVARDVDTFYSSEGAALPVCEAYKVFKDTVCSSLAGKPKLFMFLMTELEENAPHSPTPKMEEGLTDTLVLRLVSRATRANGGARVHPGAGLWALRTALEEHAHDTHLESVIRKAQEILWKDEKKIEGCEEFLVQLMGFSKEFYFNPQKCAGL